MKKTKIVIVGGGSVAWSPKIIRDMLMTESLADCEYVLYDIDKKASDQVKLFADKLARQLKISATFISTDKPKLAFSDAKYILITISTGRLPAMKYDLDIPQQYGIYHTVGDTSGPGGWARLIRNFGAFVKISNYINRYAPKALVLNYSNPMPTLTDILSRLCKNPVIGLCHGLFANISYIKELYKLDSEDQLSIKYAGLNHFFWITRANIGDTNLIEDFKRRLGRKKTFTDLVKHNKKDEMGYASNTDVATELFRLTGVMPYLGDRHTCEYFPYYITNRANMKKYNLVRTTICQRQKIFVDNSRQLQKLIKSKISNDFLIKSRETAADIINAHLTNKTFTDVGNVVNLGQISNLPKGAVVETAVKISRKGFSPVTFGEVPEPARSMMEPWTRCFSMVVDACIQKDKAIAMQALRLDPLCCHLTTDKVNEMGSRLLKVHKKYITVFK
jgi:galacturan 1,4-alpha-galacturonidase